MIRQKRLSKSKALKTIGSIQDGTFETSYDSEISPTTSPSNQIKQLVRPSISNRKKQLLVKQYLNNEIAQTELIMTKGRGNGVKVCHDVEAGVLVAEYKGDLINKSEALKREKLYAQNSTSLRMECYLFYFEHKGKVMCIDPTIPSDDLGHGRYINHRIDCNVDPIKISINGDPKIVLVSNRTILKGEEVFFDYGDRSAASLTYFPWLMDGYEQQQQQQQQQQKSKNQHHGGVQDNEDEEIDVGTEDIQESPRVKQSFGFSKYINRFKYAGYLLSDSECSDTDDDNDDIYSEEEGDPPYNNHNNNNNNSSSSNNNEIDQYNHHVKNINYELELSATTTTSTIITLTPKKRKEEDEDNENEQQQQQQTFDHHKSEDEQIVVSSETDSFKICTNDDQSLNDNGDESDKNSLTTATNNNNSNSNGKDNGIHWKDNTYELTISSISTPDINSKTINEIFNLKTEDNSNNSNNNNNNNNTNNDQQQQQLSPVNIKRIRVKYKIPE